MASRRRQLFSEVKAAAASWIEHRSPRQAAAIAFYTMVSLAPMLVLFVAIAGAWFDEETVQRRLAGEFHQFVGPSAEELVTMVLESASQPGGSGTVATVLGIVALVFGASAAFAQLQEALNTVWEVEPKEGAVVWSLLRKRILSFGMVLMIGFTLLVSLVVSAGLSAFGEVIELRYDLDRVLVQGGNFVISFVVVSVIFGLIYLVLPDVDLRWRDVLLGALVTAALFTLGKWLIGLYLGRTGRASAYGAAGSLVVFLLWVYYSSLILLFGAEYTSVWSRRRRGRPEVTEGARRQAASL